MEKLPRPERCEEVITRDVLKTVFHIDADIQLDPLHEQADVPVVSLNKGRMIDVGRKQVAFLSLVCPAASRRLQ